MELNCFTYKNEKFTCPKCNWKGKGSSLSYGDYNESSFICDMNCPSCGNHIGYWQAPLIEEVEKWKKENPGSEYEG